MTLTTRAPAVAAGQPGLCSPSATSPSASRATPFDGHVVAAGQGPKALALSYTAAGRHGDTAARVTWLFRVAVRWSAQ